MRPRIALSLAELVVVLAILAAVSGLLVPLFATNVHNANQVATQRSLVEIRDALSQYWTDTKLVTLDGVTTVATEANRLRVQWLFRNPVTGDTTFDFDPQSQIGWRGPYVTESTGDIVTFGSRTLIDAWNAEIQIQDVDSSASPRDVRVVSFGPDGVLSIPAATATASLTSSDLGDDLYVAIELR